MNQQDMLRRLPVIAISVLPIEITLPLTAAALLLDQADKRGMLDDPRLSPLKTAAQAGREYFPVDARLVLALVPEAMEMKVAARLLPANVRRLAAVGSRAVSVALALRDQLTPAPGPAGLEVAA